MQFCPEENPCTKNKPKNNGRGVKMSYIVLARKYRPQTFAEVYAQEHITAILQNAIRSNRIPHAYLFNGPRGVGKTSLARILAKSLNCVEGPTVTPCNKCHNCLEITASTSNDVIEIDGASNNSVDDIRELQSELMYAPSASKYKVYIIDEVHMLSKSAFNALLKTLEEPPENVIFIFATTEPHKVLPTIISRCQRYDFKRIPVDSIVKRIQDIVRQEGVQIDNDSIYLIARKADGGMRDALSLMDQVLSYCMNEVRIEKVREIFGLLPSQVFFNILKGIHDRDPQSVIEYLHGIFEQGTELQELINNLLEFIRVALLRKINIAPTDINPDEFAVYDEIAGMFGQNDLIYIMSYLIQTKSDIRTSSNPQLILEVVMIKLCKMEEMEELSQILAKLDKIKLSAPVSVNPVQSAVQSPVKKQQSYPEKAPLNAAPAQVSAPAPIEFDEPGHTTLDYSLESMQANWTRMVNRLKKHSNMGGVTLMQAKLLEVTDSQITIMVDGISALNTLQKNSDHIQTIVRELFDRKVKIEIRQSSAPAPSTVEIKRLNLQDVKESSPELAQFIELTKSTLLPG